MMWSKSYDLFLVCQRDQFHLKKTWFLNAFFSSASELYSQGGKEHPNFFFLFSFCTGIIHRWKPQFCLLTLYRIELIQLVYNIFLLSGKFITFIKYFFLLPFELRKQVLWRLWETKTFSASLDVLICPSSSWMHFLRICMAACRGIFWLVHKPDLHKRIVAQVRCIRGRDTH